MKRSVRQWLEDIRISDPIERKQAVLFQGMILFLAVVTMSTIPLSFVIFKKPIEGVVTNTASAIHSLLFCLSIFFLRKGFFRRSVVIASSGLLFGLGSILVLEGLRNSGWLLPAFFLPICLAGLLARRKGLFLIGSLTIVVVAGVGVLQLTTNGIVGGFPRTSDLLLPTLSTFILSIMLIIWFFDRFGASLRDALSTALEKQEELRQTRDHQEILIAERTRDLTAINRKMQSDLSLAHDIQLGLLPTHVPWSSQNVLGFGKSIPATDVGGDFYTFIAFDDPRYIAVAVGDISGKGVGAALMMSLMLSAVEAEARVNRCPAAVLTALNDHFYGRLKSNHMNAALAFVLIDLDDRLLQVANAGMVFPLLLSGGSMKEIEVGEFPLGSLPTLRYTERAVGFQAGDTVLLYTDGLAEAHNRGRELFGFDRMAAMIEAVNARAVEHLVEVMFESVIAFTAGAQQHDDMTVVAVQLLPLGKAQQPRGDDALHVLAT